MRKFVPPRRFCVVSATFDAVPARPTASLNAVIAVPITSSAMTVAPISSISVKPSSERCERMIAPEYLASLRETRDQRGQRVRVRLTVDLVRDRHGDRSQIG